MENQKRELFKLVDLAGSDSIKFGNGFENIFKASVQEKLTEVGIGILYAPELKTQQLLISLPIHNWFTWKVVVNSAFNIVHDMKPKNCLINKVTFNKLNGTTDLVGLLEIEFNYNY